MSSYAVCVVVVSVAKLIVQSQFVTLLAQLLLDNMCVLTATFYCRVALVHHVFAVQQFLDV